MRFGFLLALWLLVATVDALLPARAASLTQADRPNGGHRAPAALMQADRPNDWCRRPELLPSAASTAQCRRHRPYGLHSAASTALATGTTTTSSL